MIAKGTTHNNGVKLAAYMTTAKPGEHAELWQLRGFASENVKDAFRSVHVIAAATQCEKPFFHVQVRNPEGETLTREQWGRIADRIESKLGYSEQPRAIAFHRDEETGHEHMHIAFSRINTETMTARPLPFFKLRLKEACRELESELDLTPVRNQRESPVMAPSRDQDEQARRLGINLREVRQTIRDCWEQADNGASFRAALADEGLTLAKGDRRDYIVIDREGGMHALGKRVLGTTAAETRARMTDLDREQLPSVDEVREHLVSQREAHSLPTVASQDSEQLLARKDGAKLASEREQVVSWVAETERSARAKTPQPGCELNETAELAATAGRDFESAAGELAGAVNGVMGDLQTGLNMLGGIAAVFGDNQPPPPQSKEEAQARITARLAHAERMLQDRDYRNRVEEDKQKQLRVDGWRAILQGPSYKQQSSAQEEELEDHERQRKRRSDFQR